MRIKFLIASCLLLSSTVFVSVDAKINGLNEIVYAGKTINIAKCKSKSDYNGQASIIKSDYSIPVSIDRTFGLKSTNLEFEDNVLDFYNDVIKDKTMKIDEENDISAFTNSFDNNMLTCIYDNNVSISNLYFIYSKKVVNQTQQIENFNSNTLEELKLNLCDEFINDLTCISNNEMSYEQLFYKYGTHLITNCSLGGEFDIIGRYSSYDKKFDKQKIETVMLTQLDFEKEINLELKDYENSILSKEGYEKEYTDFSFYLFDIHGFKHSLTENCDIKDEYNSFKEELNDVNRIVDFHGNDINIGLLPLSELIPSNINIDKDKMDSELQSYLKNNMVKYDEINNDNFNFIDRYSLTVNNNGDLYTITDSGRWNQDIDSIDLNKELRYSVESFKENYKYFTVDVILDKYCMNKGYKHIYLYNDIKNRSKDDIISEYTFTGRCNTFKRVRYNMTNESYIKELNKKNFINRIKTIYDDPKNIGDNHKNLIDINKLNDDLYFVYSASGKGCDTWKNVNREYVFTFYK